MSRIVAVAETLIDAVQSVGGTLARHAAEGHDVVVIALFAAASERDAEAAQALGIAGVVSAGATPAAYHHSGLAPVPELAVALANVRPDLILAPLGLTGTPAAAQIEAALDELNLPRLRWVDLPYALSRTAGAPLGDGELLAIPVADHLQAKLDACRLLGVDSPERLSEYALSEGLRLDSGGPVELLLRQVGD